LTMELQMNLQWTRSKRRSVCLFQKLKITDLYLRQDGAEILCANSSIVSVLPDSARNGSEALIDGDCHTAWVAPLKDCVPEAVIDLGKPVIFDRIVIFAPHTNNRGTGGGNNSVRRIGVAVSGTFDGPWQEIETGEVEGPAPMCFKTGGGQVCTYINSKEPTVFQITPVRARFVRVKLLEAHWSSYAREEWKSSVALSEFMLFNSRHK
jgi:hypothetical protein